MGGVFVLATATTMKPESSALLPTLIAGGFLAALNYLGGANSTPLFLTTLAMLMALGIAIRPSNDVSLTWPVTEASLALMSVAVVLIPTTAASILPGTSRIVAVGLAVLPLAYLVTVTGLRDEWTWRNSLRLVELVAVVVMLLGVVDFLLVRNRPFSVFEDVNALGAFCNLFAIPAIAALQSATARDGLRAALASGTTARLILALACLAATASRGAHLSFVLGLVVLMALTMRRDRRSWKAPAAAAMTFVALLTAIAPLQNHPSSLTRMSDLSHDQSSADRIEMLKSTWHMVQDGPWYGTGPGTYKIRYLMYRSPAEHSTTGDLAHNDYLQFLAEGGPLLLGALLLLALACVLAVRRLWKTAKEGSNERAYEATGLAVAMLGLFGHAVLNFIFYVLPLAMLAGLYLGRLDVLNAAARQFQPFRYITRKFALLLVSAAGVFVAGTLGLQAAFYEFTTGRCELRMCGELSRDKKFTGHFAAFMVATQPSFLPVREWFLKTYAAAADRAEKPEERLSNARLAAKEMSELIRSTPSVPYVYADLARLLERFPEASAAVAAGVSTDPIALMMESVRRNPLDTTTRTQLAKRLDDAGKTSEAFTLVFDDGMRWWDVAALPETGRIALLKSAIPLARKLGRCKDATEMAQGLAVFLPGDPLAATPASTASDGILGCEG